MTKTKIQMSYWIKNIIFGPRPSSNDEGPILYNNKWLNPGNWFLSSTEWPR